MPLNQHYHHHHLYHHQASFWWANGTNSKCKCIDEWAHFLPPRVSTANRAPTSASIFTFENQIKCKLRYKYVMGRYMNWKSDVWSSKCFFPYLYILQLLFLARCCAVWTICERIRAYVGIVFVPLLCPFAVVPTTLTDRQSDFNFLVFLSVDASNPWQHSKKWEPNSNPAHRLGDVCWQYVWALIHSALCKQWQSTLALYFMYMYHVFMSFDYVSYIF